MSSEWQTFQLGEVTKFSSGSTPSRQDPDFWNGEIPWVSAKDMKSFFLSDSEDKITEQALLEGAKIAKRGSVLLLTRGMTLLSDVPICLLRRDSSFNQDVKAIQAGSPALTSEYLPYLLLGHKTKLQSLVDLAGHGTGRLATDLLLSLDVALPSPQEQKAIAHIFGTLDDKIELNRKTNETLEAMAKALFKSWFVDFDPVRAKAEGRSTGLPDDISDLFPDSFEDSELAEIPRGWEVGEIGHIVTLRKDLIDPSLTPEETFEHYSIPAFDAGKNPAKELGSSIKSQKFLVGEDNLLVSKLNPSTPRVWIPFSYTAKRSICSTEFLVCQASTDVGRAFAYCLASSDSITELMTGLAGGTSNSHQRIRPGDFLALDCCIGSQKVRSAFSDVVESLLRKTLAQRIESRSLASARDTLLPKLISGEIRIPDAEKMLEEVGI
jgi:type I restriction enzyme, S subunit